MSKADAPAHGEIDGLIADFYAAFDNRGGRSPDAAALRGMFLDEARVVRVSAGAVDAWTVEAFIAPRVAMLTDGTLVDFHEWETEAETTVFADIASRVSLYSKRGVMNGAPYAGGGRKLIQLCRARGRWRIASVLWEDA